MECLVVTGTDVIFYPSNYLGFDGTAFDEWKNFKQWETDATKERPSETVVRVKNSKISSVEKL